MNDPVAHHYPDTRLRFAGFEIDLRRVLTAAQRRRLAALGLGRRFGIVTPYNPRGRKLTAAQNRRRLAAFTSALDARAWAHAPADGLSIDRRHTELGFAVAAPRARLLALARTWRQTAIFWFDGRRFLLVPCRRGARGVALPTDGRAVGRSGGQ